jgi:MFS superfamily sulfate permease-like transporter
MLPPLPTGKEPLLQRLLPVTGWLPGYERGWLTGDVLAGLTVWALLVPEALAYASIAGVPPQYGLYCAPFALLAYAVFGVLPGVVIGVVLSLALLIQRAGSPNSAVLGKDPGGTDFADVTTHPEFQTIPGLVIYRFDGPLVFPNAERFIDEVRSLVKAGGATTGGASTDGASAGAQETRPEQPPQTAPLSSTPVAGLVIDFEATGDMDTTAADQFAGMVAVLQKQGVRVTLARVHAPVRAFMAKDGLLKTIGEDDIFPRVLDAVDSLRRT